MKNTILKPSIASDLDIRDRGNADGEPILFIHGGMGDECAAITEEPLLTKKYRIIDYHRRGWGNSKIPDAPLSLVQQATDCKAILEYLGIEKAHLVGQSYGGAISLQMALDYPTAIRSMALLEPGLPSILFNSPEMTKGVEKATVAYEAGDKKGAIEAFANEVFGADYRPLFDQNLPSGYFERYVKNADTLMLIDFPGFTNWQFTKEDAAQIPHPILNMTGADSRPYFKEIFMRIGQWLPQSENYILPNASHVMLQMNPKGAAKKFMQFFSKHPV